MPPKVATASPVDPSKECGRCLLTKLGLAQFTARLFWRFAGDWWLVFTIFDALSPHAVAARYTRPIRTHHNSTPLNISKAAGKMSKNRRLRRSAPNGPCRWGCRTDNAGAVLPRSDPASIHPRIAAWYKLGKGRCQRVQSQQSRRDVQDNRRLRLSAPNEHLGRCVVGAVEPGHTDEPGPTPQTYTPAIAAWYKLG